MNAVASELIDEAASLFVSDAKSADTILTKAELMINPETIYSDSLFTRKGDEDVLLLQNVRDAAILRCQISGRKGDFDFVLKAAKTALGAIERLPISGHSDSITVAVLGYQGFAFMKTGRFHDATKSLEKSVEKNKCISTKKKDMASKDAVGSIATYADKRKRRERVSVENALRVCYQQTGAEPPLPDLIKFPRTSHLFDAGGTSTTSDDLVMSCDDAMLRLMSDGSTRVIIEEKIDGANLGISLCPMSAKILVQNRSHYISNGEHAQFSQITEWIELHRLELVDILSGGALSPKGGIQINCQNKLILYGEWVVARHSIPYQRLPGYFIAFDLFDKDASRFYSRERFHNIMRGSGVPVVPIIEIRNFASDAKIPHQSQNEKLHASIQSQLRSLLDTPSQFRSDGGKVEGIVLRIDDETTNCINDKSRHQDTLNQKMAPSPQWLQHRSKIVRPDFIRGCADGHWSTRRVEKQRVDYEFAAEYMKRCYELASAIN